MKDAIYVRMPRCGSTTMTSICYDYNIPVYGDRDMGFWAGRKPRGGYWLPNPPLLMPNERTSKHLYECVLNYVGKDKYEKSYVFSSVRNPYSRAVSMFTHHSWNSVKTFKDFCHAIKTNQYPSAMAKWHSATLTEHIVIENDLKVDFVVRLEHIQEDFNVICDNIGIPQQQLPHRNKSKHKHYTEYYDDETREIVAEKYARDIEYFGYEFGE